MILTSTTVFQCLSRVAPPGVPAHQSSITSVNQKTLTTCSSLLVVGGGAVETCEMSQARDMLAILCNAFKHSSGCASVGATAAKTVLSTPVCH